MANANAMPPVDALRGVAEPSAWVSRFAPLVRPGGSVLDLACGNGRNGRLFLRSGHGVVFLDKDTRSVADLEGAPGAEVIAQDLETGAPWPLGARMFAAVIVVNYLHRPLFPALLAAVEPGGLLIYDTFAHGQQRFAAPRNPDHLLKRGELLETVRNRLAVIAYEYGEVSYDVFPGVRQRICAARDRSEGDHRATANTHPLYPSRPA
jgi:SAM-dependent methyltransferase